MLRAANTTEQRAGSAESLNRAGPIHPRNTNALRDEIDTTFATAPKCGAASRPRAALAVAALLVAGALIATGSQGRARAATPAGIAAARPPVGLQLAVDKLVADGQPGVIVMTRRGGEVSHATAGCSRQ
jgi:hypothetical protein